MLFRSAEPVGVSPLGRRVVSHRLATFETDGWQLESGVARHLESPDTFQIPSGEIRDSISPGQMVKLLFRILTEDESGEVEENVERMWVYVSGRVGEFYVGRLQNTASCANEFGPGIEVVFQPEHIIDFDDPPSDWQPA